MIDEDDDFIFALRRPLGWHAAIAHLFPCLSIITWEAAPRLSFDG